MSCRDMQPILHGYLDDELDLERSLEVEAHLRECAACGAEVRAQRELRAAVSAHAPYHAAPADLRKRVMALVPPAQPRIIRRWRRVAWMGVGAALVVSLFTLWTLGRPGTGRPGNVIEQEVVASHFRSLLASHLTDVASSDRHTVKPWFTGKLDFGADVYDLAAAGFPLVGGRLDYVDGRTVAALVYNHGRHVINVFVWPQPGADQRPQPGGLRGFHTLHWVAGGMTWWAVSDVSPPDLETLATLVAAEEEKGRTK